MTLTSFKDLPPNIELASHLSLLREDARIIAVNKPAGVHSEPNPGSTNDTRTVAHAMAALYPEARPLHRLDRGTSGVLLYARTDSAFTELRHHWRDRTIEKDYLTWVDGCFTAEGTLEIPLAHSPKSKKRMIVPQRHQLAQIKSWPTKTTIVSVYNSTTHTLLWVRIHTGVTHQIRATLAALGHCVLGDPIYKSAPKPLGGYSFTGLTPQSKSEYQHLIQKLFSKNLGGSHSSSQDLKQNPEPHSHLVADHGFFLHAYRLSGEGLADFEGSPIVAPPPIWFGLY